MGNIRGRADLLQARAGRDVPGRDHPGRRPIDGDLSSISDPLAGVVLMAMAAFAPYLTYRFISFVGFDMYHAIGAEQDAKNSLNRPIPLPNPQPGNPQQVLDGNTGSTPSSGQSSSGKNSPPAPATPNPSANAGATQAGTTETAAASGGGAAAAAGPAAVVVVGAQVAKDAFTAGPKAGQQLGQEAETAADAAEQNTHPVTTGTPTAGQQPTTPPPSTPVSNPPPADNPLPPPSPSQEPQL